MIYIKRCLGWTINNRKVHEDVRLFLYNEWCNGYKGGIEDARVGFTDTLCPSCKAAYDHYFEDAMEVKGEMMREDARCED